MNLGKKKSNSQADASSGRKIKGWLNSYQAPWAKSRGEKGSRGTRNAYLSREGRAAEKCDRTIMGIISCHRPVIRETMFSPERSKSTRFYEQHKLLWSLSGTAHMPHRIHGYINNTTLTKLGRNSCQQKQYFFKIQKMNNSNHSCCQLVGSCL